MAAIGADEGDLSIACSHCRLLIDVESNLATGMGTRDAKASVSLDNVSTDMRVFSANGILFGCVPEAFSENLCAFDINRDGFSAAKDKWFTVGTAADGHRDD